MILEYIEAQGVEIHRTRTHTAFAEGATRTVKDMLFKMVEADERAKKNQWTDCIFKIVLTHCNRMVHSTIGLSYFPKKRESRNRSQSKGEYCHKNQNAS